jgi:hypothetical protein
MYQSGDVVAHFKGVSIYLEVVAQHASRQKEEATLLHVIRGWNL